MQIRKTKQILYALGCDKGGSALLFYELFHAPITYAQINSVMMQVTNALFKTFSQHCDSND